MTEQAGAAQVYALAGLRIFPLWWPVPAGVSPVSSESHGQMRLGETGLQCACPRGAACSSPAKHPVIPPAHRRTGARCYGRCGQHGHGLYDATADLTTVGAWWQRWPHANIGLPAHGNGYAILDVDPRHNGDQSFKRLSIAAMADARVDLTDTLTQHTGSGGRHLLYAAPEGGIKNGARVFGVDMPGLDTRGVGGYIVTWPSVHATGGTYEWEDFLRDPAPWPAILSEYLKPAPTPSPAQTVGVSRVSSESHPPMRLTNGYATVALEREVADLLATGEGGRNHRLNRAAFSLGQLAHQGELSADQVFSALMGAALSIGLGHAESAASINSGLRAAAGKPRPARQPLTGHPT